MLFINHSLSRALAVLFILIAGSVAQNCYFPDGSLSNHKSCSADGTPSPCCASNAFCLDNGLCFVEGVVTRGSCTDQAWQSGACPGYCKEEDRNGSIAITPCSFDGTQSTFTCGLNNSGCGNASQTFSLPGNSDLVLRPAQVAALVGPVLSSAAAQASASASGRATATETSCASAHAIPSGRCFTAGQMAGLGVGLGIPFLIAAFTAIMLWNKERARHPKLMYQLPDDLNMHLKPMPPSLFPAHPAVRTIPPSRDGFPVSRDGFSLRNTRYVNSRKRNATRHANFRGAIGETNCHYDYDEFEIFARADTMTATVLKCHALYGEHIILIHRDLRSIGNLEFEHAAEKRSLSICKSYWTLSGK
ncbi:hypothetical protein BST61_g6551 [Cercospora zeina]